METENTPAQQASEGSDSQATQASESNEHTIDSLVNYDLPEPEGDGFHTGLRPLSEILKHTDQDARKHLANFRADYTRKTQALAKEKAEFEAYKRQLQQEKEDQARLMSSGKHIDALRELADNEPEYDPLDDEKAKAYMKHLAAKHHLDSLVKPFEQEQKALEKQRQVQKFKEDHPDVMTDESLRTELQAILEDNVAKQRVMALEEAYSLAHGRLALKRRQEEKVQKTQDARNRLSTLDKVSPRSSTGKIKPDYTGLSAREIFLMKKNAASTKL